MTDDPSIGTCEQCGRDSDDLEHVYRVYVVPEAWDREGSITKQPDIERWCFSCRSQYPCDPAEAPAP